MALKYPLFKAIVFDSIVGATYVYCGPLVLHLPKTEGREREDISFPAHEQRGLGQAMCGADWL